MSPNASWTFAPGVLLVIALVGGAYVRRWITARREEMRHPPGVGRLVLFLSGLLAVVVALVSPVDRLAEQILAMHMLQHVLLLDVAPILLILGLTKVILRPLTRRITVLERRAGFVAHPAFAVVLYVAAMWVWHIPALYDAAVRNDAVHALEHLTFSFAGALYWWHLLSPIRGRLRLGGLGPVAYMLSSKFAVGLLGVLLTFIPGAFYGFYSHAPHYWGLSAHDDQAVAGLIMALEQSLVMGVALAWLFMRTLAESEREQEREERRLDLAG